MRPIKALLSPCCDAGKKKNELAELKKLNTKPLYLQLNLSLYIIYYGIPLGYIKALLRRY
jgi:hypothetical protein